MYRAWYSTESFADFIINHTKLRNENVLKSKMYESDANNPTHFHTMPDHIRKILYLDAPDLIIEKDEEPVFSIEVSTEAGTGHNAFQRFARIAASVENNVPAFYIYPEAKIISRQNTNPKWDEINPLIFKALENVMQIYGIPALYYYFPSDYESYSDAQSSPHLNDSGLIYDGDIVNYPGCPDSTDPEMQRMFTAINKIVLDTNTMGVAQARETLLTRLEMRKHRDLMGVRFAQKAAGKAPEDMSPLTAVTWIPTSYLLNYLSKYESSNYEIGSLLRNRDTTALYQVDAVFRGDPYPGALAAIDYIACREGKTYEDRRFNLVIVFGCIEVDEKEKTIDIVKGKETSIDDFFNAVKQSESKNLLTKGFSELRAVDIPRYYMQVRYGSTYSKKKEIRVYSYFADAVLFHDGSLWRDG